MNARTRLEFFDWIRRILPAGSRKRLTLGNVTFWRDHSGALNYSMDTRLWDTAAVRKDIAKHFAMKVTPPITEAADAAIQSLSGPLPVTLFPTPRK